MQIMKKREKKNPSFVDVSEELRRCVHKGDASLCLLVVRD